VLDKPIANTLGKMRELLDSPEKWTKNVNARSDLGHPVHAGGKSAVAFCLQGAALKVLDINENTLLGAIGLLDKLNAVLRHLHFVLRREENSIDVTVTGWNDEKHRSYEDVVLFLKKAQIEAEIQGV
jgi:hypothetical protein